MLFSIDERESATTDFHACGHVVSPRWPAQFLQNFQQLSAGGAGLRNALRLREGSCLANFPAAVQKGRAGQHQKPGVLAGLGVRQPLEGLYGVSSQKDLVFPYDAVRAGRSLCFEEGLDCSD
jgi:hypothetical protein